MITIDYKDRRPLYQQIMDKIEELAVMGLIKPDEQLPSVRSLAADLAINPNTIQRAYAELEKKGLTYTVPGKGSFMAKSQNSIVRERTSEIRLRLTDLIDESKKLEIKLDYFQNMVTEIWQKSPTTFKGGLEK
ncbi:MAG: GntR family transcriptional regulator [Bacillota bacterium]|jgi:GntR family transcriptional regulator